MFNCGASTPTGPFIVTGFECSIVEIIGCVPGLGVCVGCWMSAVMMTVPCAVPVDSATSAWDAKSLVNVVFCRSNEAEWISTDG